MVSQWSSMCPSVCAYSNGYLCSCRLWTVSMYLNGIYSVSHIKFSFMWLKFLFCGYFLATVYRMSVFPLVFYFIDDSLSKYQWIFTKH